MKVRLKEWRLVDLGEVELPELPPLWGVFEHHGVRMQVETLEHCTPNGLLCIEVKRLEDDEPETEAEADRRMEAASWFSKGDD